MSCNSIRANGLACSLVIRYDTQPKHTGMTHFLTSVSATTLLPILTFVAQNTLRLKAEAVTRVVKDKLLKRNEIEAIKALEDIETLD